MEELRLGSRTLQPRRQLLAEGARVPIGKRALEILSVLAEASLAFLGLGTQPPQPSWGAMLNASRAYLRVDPWMAIGPGIVLALLLLGLNYLADALREAFDPRRVNAGF